MTSAVRLQLGAVLQLTPAGRSTVAELVIAPVALSDTVPLTLMTMEPPTGRLTLPRRMLLPLPLAPVPAVVLSQSAPVLGAVHVQLVTETAAGTKSVTTAPTASAGPSLATLMSYFSA